MPCVSYLLIIEAVAVVSLRRDVRVAAQNTGNDYEVKSYSNGLDEYSGVLRRSGYGTD
jgi:hypothetical protein